jgi:hypothetical protein
VISGEFGMVGLLQERKNAMQGWLTDPLDRVRAFAELHIQQAGWWRQPAASEYGVIALLVVLVAFVLVLIAWLGSMIL